MLKCYVSTVLTHQECIVVVEHNRSLEVSHKQKVIDVHKSVDKPPRCELGREQFDGFIKFGFWAEDFLQGYSEG